MNASGTVDLHAHAIVPDALIEMQRAQPEYGPVLTDDAETPVGYVSLEDVP